MANVSIIGSGFSGLAASCFAANEKHRVTVIEKNTTTGGRARSYTAEGFTFDMAENDSVLYEQLKPSAMKLGAAFQKVNFLRDLKNDYEVLGRIYFLQVDLTIFSEKEKLRSNRILNFLPVPMLNIASE